MLGNMFNKNMMEKMRVQLEEIKVKLDNISVLGAADNIKVVANGNRLLTSIDIDADFFKTANKKQVEELIVLAANRALEQAERVEKSEMSHAAMGMLPGLG